MHGAELAQKVRKVRMALEALSRRFSHRQQKAAGRGDPFAEDGTQQALLDQVVIPWGLTTSPTLPAGILEGLHLPVAPVLPTQPCWPGGLDWLDLDGETYLTRLDDGPPQSRLFSDMTALVLYIAPLKTMRILWIGAELDLASAERDLKNQTGNWTNWVSVSDRYAIWLATECQRRLPDPL